jgi:hypothetical protein
VPPVLLRLRPTRRHRSRRGRSRASTARGARGTRGTGGLRRRRRLQKNGRARRCGSGDRATGSPRGASSEHLLVGTRDVNYA